jgi:hypothetical protein
MLRNAVSMCAECICIFRLAAMPMNVRMNMSLTTRENVSE